MEIFYSGLAWNDHIIRTLNEKNIPYVSGVDNPPKVPQVYPVEAI